jgi:hypothetical protein
MGQERYGRTLGRLPGAKGVAAQARCGEATGTAPKGRQRGLASTLVVWGSRRGQ